MKNENIINLYKEKDSFLYESREKFICTLLNIVFEIFM